ncbi:Bax inhibitor-1/YccA family protein [Micrococcales bacterium 31B]|nr:Bax inhibitor-1/YccA family protein [Micrococcales bacterium 31B]
MPNPVLKNDKMFQPGGYAGFDAPYGQPQSRGTQQQPYGQQQAPYQQPYGQQQAPYQQYPQQGGGTVPPVNDLNAMYNSPAASNARMGRMTYEDVVMRTSMLFGILLVGFVGAWFAPTGLKLPLMIGGALVGFVLGLVNSFKSKPSPLLIGIYAAAQGLFLGGISWTFELMYPGIVMQAVLATLSVFAAVLLGFRSGKLRTSPKLTRIFMIAMIGYAIFSLVNLVLVMTGALDGWGMRSGPLGLIIGVIAVLLAAYSLVMDFETVQQGVKNGVPQVYSWKCGFGLLVTLVWMYLEILRIIAILRGSD